MIVLSMDPNTKSDGTIALTLTQWLPKPATSQFPGKRRSLRETWSPGRGDSYWSLRVDPRGVGNGVRNRLEKRLDLEQTRFHPDTVDSQAESVSREETFAT